MGSMADDTPNEEAVTAILLKRCVALTFKERKNNQHRKIKSISNPRDCEQLESHTSNYKCGHQLFNRFKECNARCFWNPHLEESINNLNIVGYLQPSSSNSTCVILLGGRDIYLDTVKSAWARRVIKSPQPYVLHKVGEICGLEQTVIPQTQFSPLPEVLCLMVSELEDQKCSTTFDALLDALKLRYKGMHQPGEQIVYESLGALVQEGKLYHTGNGYFIDNPHAPYHQQRKFQPQLYPQCELHPFLTSTPSHPQHSPIPYDPTSPKPAQTDSTLAGVTPTVYIPVLCGGNTPAEVCSISCQTSGNEPDISPDIRAVDDGNKLLETLPSPPQSPPQSPIKNTQHASGSSLEVSERAARFQRSQSLRGKLSRDRRERLDDVSGLSRSASLRHGEKGEKLAMKENRATETYPPERERAEKTSLLNKLFGRNKKHFSRPDDLLISSITTSPIEEDVEETLTEQKPELKKEVEYATFSGQFPPPELHFYQYQSQSIHRPVVSDVVHDWPLGDDHRDQECTPSEQCHENNQSVLSNIAVESSDNDVINANPVYDVPKRLQRTDRERNASSEHPVPSSHPPGSCHRSSLVKGEKRNPVVEDNDLYEVMPDRTIVSTNGLTQETAKKQPSLPPPRHRNDIHIEYHGHMPRKGTMYSMSRDSGVNCVGLPTKCLQKVDDQDESVAYGEESSKTIKEKTYGTADPLRIENHQDSGFSSPRTDSTDYPVNKPVRSLPRKTSPLAAGNGKSKDSSSMERDLPTERLGDPLEMNTEPECGRKITDVPYKYSMESMHITGSECYHTNTAINGYQPMNRGYTSHVPVTTNGYSSNQSIDVHQQDISPAWRQALLTTDGHHRENHQNEPRENHRHHYERHGSGNLKMLYRHSSMPSEERTRKHHKPSRRQSDNKHRHSHPLREYNGVHSVEVKHRHGHDERSSKRKSALIDRRVSKDMGDYRIRVGHGDVQLGVI